MAAEWERGEPIDGEFPMRHIPTDTLFFCRPGTGRPGGGGMNAAAVLLDRLLASQDVRGDVARVSGSVKHGEALAGKESRA